MKIGMEKNQYEQKVQWLLKEGKIQASKVRLQNESQAR